ncbi:MAG TPA: shikimate dehydrogenase [Solirubrobacteraceae bacterium]
MIQRLGVVGWPVDHSRSPAMFQAAFQHLGLEHDHRYQRVPIPPELAAETIAALGGAGFAGVNVTMPHKATALGIATVATDRAKAIGAANTLTFEPDGTIHADNTDAPGLIDALGEPPRTALVLGAGGSARAVVWALKEAGTDVSVLARTPARAEGLGARIVDAPTPADCLVNCTPIGMDDPDALPADPEPYATVVDLVYQSGRTALLRRAEAAGARTVDGIEVLVRQGALSFERWTGLEAPLDAMRRGARHVV